MRVVRNEFSFLSFARALMQERREAEFSQLEQTHKVSERVGGGAGGVVNLNMIEPQAVYNREGGVWSISQF